MSVHVEVRPNGQRMYKVRWRDGGRQRSRSFDKRADAQAWDTHVRRARQMGDLSALDRGSILLADYAADWWERYAIEALSDNAQEVYSVQLRLRILPTLGHFELRAITPAEVQRWMAAMRKSGDRDPTIVKALTVLQSILRDAEQNGHVERNAVAVVRKPSQKRQRQPVMIAPLAVERMRAHMLRSGWQVDAALISTLAYAGLRPESEGITLTWERVRARTILIPAGGKRGAVDRTIRTWDALNADLRDWQLASGRRSGLVFPAPAGKRAWSTSDYDNWRERRFDPAAKAAGLPAHTRPRDLRSSFASLLIAGGRNILFVAKQMGHRKETLLRIYAELFEEFEEAAAIDPEALIASARAATFSGVFPLRSPRPLSDAG